MVRDGDTMPDLWRHVVIQLLDDYESDRRLRGASVAAEMFTEEPDGTGEERLDAALAALAEHLGRRDGWHVPEWASRPMRTTPRWWFVSELEGMHPRALVESPLSFRKRGVFITDDALVRV